MLTRYDKYRDIVILSSSEPLGRWPEGEKQGSRNVSGMVPARDLPAQALTLLNLGSTRCKNSSKLVSRSLAQALSG